jgi:hypothetical protein
VRKGTFARVLYFLLHLLIHVAGFSTDQISAGGNHVQLCPPDYHAPVRGLSVCEKCQPGYTNNLLRSQCEDVNECQVRESNSAR